MIGTTFVKMLKLAIHDVVIYKEKESLRVTRCNSVDMGNDNSFDMDNTIKSNPMSQSRQGDGTGT